MGNRFLKDNHMFVKPFRYEELVMTVRRVCSGEAKAKCNE
jgi:hypothetical protein